MTGFIGRNLKEQFDKEFKVIAPSHENLDLLNEYSVEKFLKEYHFDIVIHTANTNNTRNKTVTSYDSLDGNLRMFFNLERCMDYYGKMYYFGSGAEYDMRHYIPSMNEDYFDTYVPKDPYGFSKYVMSKSCRTDESGFLKLDCSKLKRVFNWKPRWNIEEAMRKCVDAYCVTGSGDDLRECINC